MFHLFVLWCALLEFVICFAEVSTQQRGFWKCSLSNPTEYGCLCLPSKSGGFTLQCPIPNHENRLTATYDVRNAHGTSSFVIECPCNQTNPLTESVYTYLKGIPPTNISELEFNYCPLPLETFPTFLGGQFNLSFIQHLTLRSCKPIPTLPHDLLRNVSQLTKLVLPDNHIQYLPDNLLEDQFNLKTLRLEKNKLENISGKIFRNLIRLQSLQLGSNGIKQLDTDAFSNLTDLVQLNLQNNYIGALPSKLLDSLTNLLYMDLSNNELVTLDKDAFQSNTKLIELFLRNNSFEVLPSGLFSHNKVLKKLSLQSNIKLAIVPPDIFGNLRMLQDLDLSRCRFNQSSFDSRTFENLTQLTTLNLARNQLSGLNPDWFLKLTNLTSLDLSNNQLASIEINVFNSLQALSTLRLSGNHLVSLKANTFGGLRALKNLFLQDNQLALIEPEAMTDLKEMVQINLARNFLKFDEGLINPGDGLRQSPLQNNLKLEIIDLTGNQISDFFSDWMYMMRFLTNLNLKHNLISSLAFSDLMGFSPKKDFTIDLSHNQIKHFTFPSAKEFDVQRGDTEKTLLLDGNPLVCDCDAYSLAQYMNRSMHGVKHSWTIDAPRLTCQEPSSLAGIAPTAVNPSLLVCKCGGNYYSSCGCYKRPSDQTVLLECQEKNLTHIPTPIPSYPGYKVQMNLSSNWIIIGHENSGTFANVDTLDLSYNDMDSSKFGSLGWPQQLHRRFPDLRRLDLTNNNFSLMSSGVVDALNESSNLVFLLSGNPWVCDCSNLALLKFIYGSWKRIEDFNRMVCSNGLLISDLSVEKLCPSTAPKYLAIAMPLLALVLFCVCLLVYRSRRTILAWMYNRRLCLRCVVKEDEEENDERKYDAFISFSHLDEDFVIQELVPQLERPPPGLPDYRLCLHYRDWLAGEWIPDQIVRSVASSKRTVVVLSDNFLESLWGKLEFRTAYQQVLKDKSMRLIVIVKGELPPKENMDQELQSYLSLNTYLKWNDPWFWDRLRYALPHKKDSSSSGSKISRVIREHGERGEPVCKEEANGVKLNHLPPLPLLTDREKQKVHVMLPPDIEISLTPTSSASSTAPFFPTSPK